MTLSRATKPTITAPVPDLAESVRLCAKEYPVTTEHVKDAIDQKRELWERIGTLDGRTALLHSVPIANEEVETVEERLQGMFLRISEKYEDWNITTKVYIVRGTSRPQLCLSHINGNRHWHLPVGEALRVLVEREPRLAAHIPSLRRSLRTARRSEHVVTTLSVNPYDLLTCGNGEFTSCYATGREFDAGGYQLWFDARSFVIMSYRPNGTRIWRTIGVFNQDFTAVALRRYYGREGAGYEKAALALLQRIEPRLATPDALILSHTTIQTPRPGYEDPIAAVFALPQMFSRSSMTLSLSRAPCPRCGADLRARFGESHDAHLRDDADDDD